MHRGQVAAAVSAAPAPTAAPGRTVVVLLWLALGVIGLLLGSPLDYGPGMAVLSGAHLVFGGWVFWTHGGRWITAAGVYSLASAAFFGYAGLWWIDRLHGDMPAHFFTASAVGYFTHVLMYALFWVRSDSKYPTESLARTSPELGDWAAGLGLFFSLTAGAVVTAFDGIRYVDAVLFVGVVLFTVGILTRERKVSPSTAADRLRGVRPDRAHRRGLTPARAVGMTLAVGLYVGTTFQGGGRLHVVVLLIAIALLAATRLRGRRMKALVVLGAPVVVFALTALRTVYFQQLFGPGVGRGEQGPDSTVNPFETFARLLDPHLVFQHGDGSTFWATLTIFVPRALWDDKPIGFGAVLTRFLEPELVAVNHSMAALVTGEWYYNWGWLGLAAMVPVVGYAVRLLDHTAGRWFAAELTSRIRVLRLAISVVLVAGLADYVWVGSFTYGERAGLRTAILLIFALLFAAKGPGERRTQEKKPTTDFARLQTPRRRP